MSILKEHLQQFKVHKTQVREAGNEIEIQKQQNLNSWDKICNSIILPAMRRVKEELLAECFTCDISDKRAQLPHIGGSTEYYKEITIAVSDRATVEGELLCAVSIDSGVVEFNIKRKNSCVRGMLSTFIPPDKIPDIPLSEITKDKVIEVIETFIKHIFAV